MKYAADRELMWFWICSLPAVGVVTIERMLEVYGDIEEVFRCTEKTLDGLPGISEKAKQQLGKTRDMARIEQAWERMRQKDISFISCEHKSYPERLRHIFEYPKGLFYCGSLEAFASARRCAAIVGARQCTAWGQSEAGKFAKTLSEYGLHIISGMASGIDAAAHRGALSADCATTAVLGCGADICYPAKNQAVYEKIKACGCILSEYPPGTAPAPWHFPRRNRIISGMADAVIVVEARKKSGSLITADMGLDQGKDVFAVPGRGCDALSEGCNNLIRQGAFLADKPEDILNFYHIELRHQKKNKIILDKSENMVYSSLCLAPKYIEEICAETSMTAGEVISILFRLEKSGMVKRLSAQQYVVNQSMEER